MSDIGNDAPESSIKVITMGKTWCQKVGKCDRHFLTISMKDLKLTRRRLSDKINSFASLKKYVICTSYLPGTLLGKTVTRHTNLCSYET